MTTDAATRAAYTMHAAAYAEDWLSQPPPTDLQDTVRRWFRSGADGGLTVDIGSGSGRDVDWLNRHGYPCIGVEPVDALRSASIARFPQWSFVAAELPDLDNVVSSSFDNVLCETVIMHLPTSAIGAAIAGLRRILKRDGTLYVSWRIGDTHQRDDRGRLYSGFDRALVESALAGLAIVYSEEGISASSGKRIHALVARASAR